MRPVLLLGKLNEIDLAIDGIRARMSEIAEALKEPPALAAARAAAAAAEAALADGRRAQAECEFAQQHVVARLTQAEGRLYGGRVRNPKELEDAEKDVAQLRRQAAAAEDALLEALIAVDAATEAHVAAQADLTQRSEAWAETQTARRAEQAQLAERLSAERARQAATRRAVPPHILQTYDSLRPRRGGRAVARLDGDTCAVCLVAVPPLKAEAAREGDALVYCENCGRLLLSDTFAEATG